MVIVFVVLALAVAGKPMAERIAPVLEPAAALPNLMLLHSFGITQTLSLDFPSWSISAEWFLYLLFPTLAAFVLRIGPRGAIISAIVFALMLAIAREAFGLRDWTRSTFDFGMLRRSRALSPAWPFAVLSNVRRFGGCPGTGFTEPDCCSLRSCSPPHRRQLRLHFFWLSSGWSRSPTAAAGRPS